MVACERNIACVALEGCNECLRGVVPDLHGLVVGGGEEVWLVGLRVVIDVVDTLRFVGLEGEVGMGGAEVPDLDSAIQTCGGESVGILGVNGHSHNIVAVTFKDLHTLPALLPIPKLDCHVIGGCEHKRLGRVDGNRTNVIGVCFERGDFFGSVIVVDTELEVIGAANNPVLPRNESTSADGDIGEFERFDDRLDSMRVR